MPLLILMMLLALHQPAKAEPPRVEFAQRLGAIVPSDLVLFDERGRQVRFDQLTRGKPSLLVLGYYHCPMLCHQVQSGLVDSLGKLEWSVGHEFNVISVSIDPRERPELARKKQHSYLSRYDRPGAEEGWRFLTGGQEQIKKLCETVGFESVYDPQTDQFAHPAGVVVLTAEGKVSSYLLGISFPSRAIKLALQRASSGGVGDPVDQILLLCYHYDPSTGRYSLAIMRLMQMAGLATVLLLAGGIGWMQRRKS
ncbi:MAG: SCO family protein [Candidatus Eremiobacteraeota bacterium]|nr:SCO family protein [Candidatus Eremiobacteraeota bacterium]